MASVYRRLDLHPTGRGAGEDADDSMKPMLEIVTNRDTERANHAKGAISEIEESISYVLSIGADSSTPPASTNFQETIRHRIHPSRYSRSASKHTDGTL